MQDLYYSKKLDQYFPTRVDYLLYAHDGRGLGHVSRTTAVGLALKRLYPEARVLLITGSAKTHIMVGRGALDWIKLPSYQTVLTAGASEGRDGESGFYRNGWPTWREQADRQRADMAAGRAPVDWERSLTKSPTDWQR